jgi:RNA recognition motif-containing protein
MKNVYVGNLPHSTSESELRNLFQTHGDIERVSMVTDRDTGRSRGFAFVEMTNSEEAEKAIATLNGSDLGGRTLIVNEAKPKTDRPRGGGGQRFGGGGRDGSRGQSRQRREPRW